MLPSVTMAKRVILHATDFSPASRSAFARAIELTKGTNGQLLVLHVLNPMVPVIGARPIEPPTYARLQQASRAWALKQLARLTDRAKAARVRVTAVLVEGSEAGTIARLARSRRAWMIVMGTHGRTGIERVLLGSVAARVVSLASCPVMTVRAR
jgi:nucleotide-binding universal stress UspA family protein